MDPEKFARHTELLARMGMVHTEVYGPTDMTDETVQNRMREVAASAADVPSSFNLQNDFDLGNQVRMLMRQDSAHEAVVCAARDRIFQLSLRVAYLEAALKPFSFVADMEERAEAGASVMVNVSRCRDARTALSRTSEVKS